MSAAVSDAFRYSKLVLATTTYNGSIYPFMHDFIHRLVEHKFQKRTVGIIENGSWGPQVEKIVKEMLGECNGIEFTKNIVHIKSALNEANQEEMEKMAYELCQEYIEHDDVLANKENMTALFKIGYGLYVITTREGDKDTGCIANAVTQVTNTPNRIAVTINKANYTHDVVMRTKKLIVNCLSVDAPFAVFQHFGFQSGRDVNKFETWPLLRAANGLPYLPKYINSFMALDVEATQDFGTHTMFICSVAEARVISGRETMTYNYYQDNVKPKPQPTGKKGFVCTVCGYIYEGDELPADFICPICKHPASDFKPL
jgi:flavin reductase (DIM6/NTAB) family NADH-FMN oxidoreductase RutF